MGSCVGQPWAAYSITTKTPTSSVPAVKVHPPEVVLNGEKLSLSSDTAVVSKRSSRLSERSVPSAKSPPPDIGSSEELPSSSEVASISTGPSSRSKGSVYFLPELLVNGEKLSADSEATSVNTGSSDRSRGGLKKQRVASEQLEVSGISAVSLEEVQPQVNTLIRFLTII